MQVGKLEAKYRAACSEGLVGGVDDDLQEDEMDFEPFQMGGDEHQNEAVKLIGSMQAEAACLDVLQDGADEGAPKPDADLDDMPDSEEIKKVVLADTCQIDPGALPVTLRDAISRPGDLFNSLWRMAVKHRSSAGGCDIGFLPNGQSSRRAAKNLNWHQWLGAVYCNMFLFYNWFCNTMSLL